eukprot:3113111-Prymnesium_polylepis.1
MHKTVFNVNEKCKAERTRPERLHRHQRLLSAMFVSAPYSIKGKQVAARAPSRSSSPLPTAIPIAISPPLPPPASPPLPTSAATATLTDSKAVALAAGTDAVAQAIGFQDDGVQA